MGSYGCLPDDLAMGLSWGWRLLARLAALVLAPLRKDKPAGAMRDARGVCTIS